MKRITYLLKDQYNEVRGRVHAQEGETPTVEPWMLHNIQTRGWRLEQWETNEAGVDAHGFADWQSVADHLASALRTLLSDEVAPDPAVMDALFEQAQAALDDYDVANMEVLVAKVHVEDDDSQEGDDAEG